MQFLLGVFYYIEAAVLFEDIEASVKHINLTNPAEHRDYFLGGVKYFDRGNVTNAYRNAA